MYPFGEGSAKICNNLLLCKHFPQKDFENLANGAVTTHACAAEGTMLLADDASRAQWHPGTLPAGKRLFCSCILVFSAWGILAHEERILENQQIDGSDSYTAVCEIEDRSEEQEPLASHKRHPGRPDRVDQREVEHVDNSSEHEWGIVENQSVEQTVDEVAHSSGGN